MNDPIVAPFYIRKRCANTGPNHSLQCHPVKIKRKIGIQYELYSLFGPDPNQYTLLKDENYHRLRVRRIWTYIDKNGNMRENIANDYPLDPKKYDDPSYDFRPWY